MDTKSASRVLGSEGLRKCAVCFKPASKSCSDCARVHYCGQEHQKEDWKRHKLECINHEYAFDGKNGLCLVAKRKISIGNVIFKELPDVVFPVMESWVGKTNPKYEHPCYGCFAHISDATKVIRCKKCGLSLCSVQCGQKIVHRDRECSALNGVLNNKHLKKRLPKGIGIYYLYIDICVVNCIYLRKRCPVIWQIFKNLMSSERFMRTERNPELMADFYGGTSKCNLPYSLMLNSDANEVKAVYIAFKCLSLIFPSCTPQMRTIFLTSACMLHTCLANAVLLENGTSYPGYLAQAVKPIAKGEVITLNYSGLLYSSTWERRAELFKKNIVCTCQLCLDPSEYCTFSGALKCDDCTLGLYTDLNPTHIIDPYSSKQMEEEYENSLWKCTCCDSAISRSKIEKLNQEMTSQWVEMITDRTVSNMEVALKWIRFHTKNNHSKHSSVLNAKYRYLQCSRDLMINRQNYDITDDCDPDLISLNPFPSDLTPECLEDLANRRDFSLDLMIYLKQIDSVCILEYGYLLLEYNWFTLVLKVNEFMLGDLTSDELGTTMKNVEGGILSAFQTLSLFARRPVDIVFTKMAKKCHQYVCFALTKGKTPRQWVGLFLDGLNLLEQLSIPQLEELGDNSELNCALATNIISDADQEIIKENNTESNNSDPVSSQSQTLRNADVSKMNININTVEEVMCKETEIADTEDSFHDIINENQDPYSENGNDNQCRVIGSTNVEEKIMEKGEDSDSRNSQSGLGRGGNNCFLCHQPASICCEDCKLVYYCCTIHRKKDRKRHKPECSSYNVQVHEEHGVCLTAQRDISKDSVIFDEAPIALFPLLKSGVDDEHDKYIHPCYGCFKLLPNVRKIHRCRNCGLSLCGEQCEMRKCHRNRECSILQNLLTERLRKRPLPTGIDIYYEYLDICTLSILQLRVKNPYFWETLQYLTFTPRFKVCTLNNKIMAEFYGGKSTCNLSNCILYEKNVSTIMEAFIFVVCFSRLLTSVHTPIRALFLTQTLMPQSCMANAVLVLDQNQPPRFLARAIKPIVKDEVICADLSGLIFSSTEERDTTLLNLNIVCQCDRCLDPTEFNTFAGSLACFKCPTGMYLNSDTSQVYSSNYTFKEKCNSIQKEAVWKCSQCNDTLSREQIDYINRKMTKGFEEWSTNPKICLLKAALHWMESCEERSLQHTTILNAKRIYLEQARNLMILKQGYIIEDHHDPNDIVLSEEFEWWSTEGLEVLINRRDFSYDLLTHLDKVKLTGIREYGYFQFEHHWCAILLKVNEFLFYHGSVMDLIRDITLDETAIGEACNTLKMYSKTPYDVVYGQLAQSCYECVNFAVMGNTTLEERLVTLLVELSVIDWLSKPLCLDLESDDDVIEEILSDD